MRPDAHLHAMLSRYRKRRTRSLDGHVHGLDYNRPCGEYATAPVPNGPPHHESYDPSPGLIQLDLPEYGPPEYDDRVAPVTPHLSTPLPHRDVHVERRADYDAMLQTDAIIEELHQEWQALHDGADPSPAMPGEVAPIDFEAPVAATMPESYYTAPLTQAEFDQAMDTLGPRDPMEAMDGQPGLESQTGEPDTPQALSLDQIVEQEWPDPWRDPDPFQQMQLMYDQQMMQLLNPFMMPGPMM